MEGWRGKEDETRGWIEGGRERGMEGGRERDEEGWRGRRMKQEDG